MTAPEVKSLWTLKPGDIHDFNGCPVRLLRDVAAHDGHTWRVEAMDGKHKGERFNIPPSMLDRLDRNPIGEAE